MYDEKKIEDSLEFVKQIKLYRVGDPEKLIEELKMEDNISPSYFSEVNEPVMEEEPVTDAKPGNDTSEFEDDFEYEEAEDDKWTFGDFLYVIGCVAAAVLLAFVVTHYIAHHTRVDGSSMNNTLNDDDYLIIEKVSYYLHDPERFDVVVFPFNNDVNYIKRIIGLPGEVVQIKDGYVYIDGKLLEEDVYGNARIEDPGLASEPIELDEDEYFVLGDNRNSSIDSRKRSVGNIKGANIDGKAVLRLYPFDSFGTIK